MEPNQRTLSILNWVMVGATAAMAVATIVLVILTFLYVRLTNNLVRLQIIPSVECGFDQHFNAKSFVLHNSGSEAVIDVKVYWVHYVFRDHNQPPIVTFGSVQPLIAKETAWWSIPRLQPGQVFNKDLSDLAQNMVHNEDAHRTTLRLQAEREGLKPKDIALASRVLFTVVYKREVDGRAFSVSRAAFVAKDSQTGRAFMWQRIFPSSPKTLEEVER